MDDILFEENQYKIGFSENNTHIVYDILDGNTVLYIIRKAFELSLSRTGKNIQLRFFKIRDDNKAYFDEEMTKIIRKKIKKISRQNHMFKYIYEHDILNCEILFTIEYDRGNFNMVYNKQNIVCNANLDKFNIICH